MFILILLIRILRVLTSLLPLTNDALKRIKNTRPGNVKDETLETFS
jgi:hypothetical protein